LAQLDLAALQRAAWKRWGTEIADGVSAGPDTIREELRNNLLPPGIYVIGFRLMKFLLNLSR
jgi:hypothetical protein